LRSSIPRAMRCFYLNNRVNKVALAQNWVNALQRAAVSSSTVPMEFQENFARKICRLALRPEQARLGT
jgi:hypothetical protein